MTSERKLVEVIISGTMAGLAYEDSEYGRLMKEEPDLKKKPPPKRPKGKS